MIVQRFILQYKPGMLEKAASLMSAEATRVMVLPEYGKQPIVRHLIPKHQEDMLVGEYTFDDEEHMAQFWQCWDADPDAQPFKQKHSTMKVSDKIEMLEVLDYDAYLK